MSDSSDGGPCLAAVILAAGRSSRMPGRSKLVLDFRGTSVIRTVALTAIDAGLAPVFVVVGPASAEVAEELADLPLRIETPDAEQDSRIASVSCGLKAALRESVEGVVLLLGDEPEVDGSDIRAVRRAVAEGVEGIVRARYRDRPGHPVIVSRNVARRFARLESVEGDPDRVWDRLSRLSACREEVCIDRPGPIDVDTPEALHEARDRNRGS